MNQTIYDEILTMFKLRSSCEAWGDVYMMKNT